MENIDYTKIPLMNSLSTIDERDWTIARVSEPDTTLNYKTDISGIDTENQFLIDGCVGKAHSVALAISRKVQLGEKPLHFSSGMTYANRSSTDIQTPGMQPRQCDQHYVKEGVCLYDDFTDWEEYPAIKTVFDKVKALLYPKAEKYKVKAYYSLNGIEEIKAGIKKYGAVKVTLPIYKSFYDTPQNNNIVPMIDNPIDLNKVVGFHRVLFYGWQDGQYFLCRNSWGKEWGSLNGDCLVPFDFPIFEATAYNVTVDTPIPTPIIKTYWKVQACANLFKVFAQNNEAKINKAGIVTYLIKEGLFWKVQCGVFTDESHKNDMVAKLQSLGFKPYVIEYTK